MQRFVLVVILLWFLPCAQAGNGVLAGFSAASDTITTSEADIRSLDKAELKKRIAEQMSQHPVSDSIDLSWLKALHETEPAGDVLPETGDVEEATGSRLSTKLLKKRLAALDRRTPFDVSYSPVLENLIRKYLKSHRKAIRLVVERSPYYFPMFEEELDKHGLPLELKYVPVVESELRPLARSRAGATGLWQFMLKTGRMNGLEVNSSIDERSDPVKSTVAACKYLTILYGMFDDWNLALAAYNSGPGNVSKAIRRSGGQTNYWKIRPYLPRETADYLPKFLASLYIYEYAAEHGFEVPAEARRNFQVDTLHVRRTLDFDTLSELLDTDAEELKYLNPEYKRGVISHTEGKIRVLRLPVDAAGRFVSAEELIYAYVDKVDEAREITRAQSVKEPDRIVYRVRKGDYLGRIAKRYGVRISDIKKWNNLRSDRIRIGQRLTIYRR